MAKLLLSSDQSIFSYNGEYYSKNEERHNMLQRYLRVFDKLRLAVRCEKKSKKEKEWVKIDTSVIEVTDIPNFSGPAQYLKVYNSVGRAIKNAVNECDAAIIRIPSTLGQRVAHKVMKGGIPYAVEVVYDAGDGAANSKTVLERLLWKYMDMDMKKISYGADGVSCVTERFLQQHYYSKKTNSFVSNYSSLALDKSFFTSPKSYPKRLDMHIIHVASQVDYSTRKGHIQIIDMLSLLKKRNIRPEVSFVGQDYHNGISLLKKKCIELGVEQQVTFTGRVNRQRLSEILDCGDLFVFPTAAEGLPRVVIEAMAKGLPCVISDVSGNPELVSHEMLVNYLDVEQLANKVERLIKDRDLYEATSQQNFKKSLAYEASLLQARRDKFYTELRRCTDNY